MFVPLFFYFVFVCWSQEEKETRRRTQKWFHSYSHSITITQIFQLFFVFIKIFHSILSFSFILHKEHKMHTQHNFRLLTCVPGGRIRCFWTNFLSCSHDRSLSILASVSSSKKWAKLLCGNKKTFRKFASNKNNLNNKQFLN